MLRKREGFPEEDEFVLCTVTGINPHSVFVTLDEFGGRTGMIHISEVAPGRIRNIKDYVQEGKKVVCKVIQIREDRGHIDLSLRRVNEAQKRRKLNEIKQEQVAEKIIETVARQQKKKTEELYKKISEKLLEEYESLYEAFEDVVAEELDLSKYTDKRTAEMLTEIIKQRIKPEIIAIGGDVQLSSYEPNGIDLVKKTLQAIEKEGVEVRYLGAGMHHIELRGEDYKEAEKTLKKALESAEKLAKKNNIEFKFTRKELEA
ncbi:translation initiation factor IF-2 subunit alpha [Candidatus Woesearchaeota archaeon]|nr:translation initiation factor IF-2 subunit alpha [Candidatus Woesearchaeota archaeon]